MKDDVRVIASKHYTHHVVLMGRGTDVWQHPNGIHLMLNDILTRES